MTWLRWLADGTPVLVELAVLWVVALGVSLVTRGIVAWRARARGLRLAPMGTEASMVMLGFVSLPGVLIGYVLWHFPAHWPGWTGPALWAMEAVAQGWFTQGLWLDARAADPARGPMAS